MKTNSLLWAVGIGFLAIVAVVGMFMYGGAQEASVVGQIVHNDAGDVVGPWTNTIVQYKLSVKDEFTGADVAATAKVYDEQPSEWGNPRGSFDDASAYTVYTASNGYVTINDEKPGDYFVVMTASNFNTEFVKITIPDGTGRSIDVADYNAAPDVTSAPMAELGTTTDEDFALTLVNDTSAEIDEIVNPKVADNTEFRSWKVIVNDENGFSTDTDGNGVYDEGISYYAVIVNGDKHVIFDSNNAIDEFDSNDQYTFFTDAVIADGARLNIEVEINAATGDYAGANDEVLGEGDGVISYIKTYDLEGNLFETSDVTA